MGESSLYLVIPFKEFRTAQIVRSLGLYLDIGQHFNWMIRKMNVVPADHVGTIRAILLIIKDLKEMEIM